MQPEQFNEEKTAEGHRCNRSQKRSFSGEMSSDDPQLQLWRPAGSTELQAERLILKAAFFSLS